jgi:hypothetical protein
MLRRVLQRQVPGLAGDRDPHRGWRGPAAWGVESAGATLGVGRMCAVVVLF